MNKRLLLLGIICLGWSGTRADHGLKGKKPKTTEKVHVVSINNRSQSDFRVLFLTNSQNNYSGAKLNPRAISFVQDYIEKNGRDLMEMKDWGRPYFNTIDEILTQYGLPRELKYLAVIESNLKPNSVSWVGAVGPWQLMPATARVLGLKVTHRIDERTNYYKSTRAAAKYLKDLYHDLGDWLLVIAAYNGGPGHVYNAINRSHSRNFWDLQYYLPAESRKHVKKFIATHYIFEGQGGVTTLTSEEATMQLSGSAMYVFNRSLNREELNNSKSISISGKYYSVSIAKYTMMDMSDFNRYNPDFDKIMSGPNNTYDLWLPSEKIELFAANRYPILSESMQMFIEEELTENTAQKTSRDLVKENRW